MRNVIRSEQINHTHTTKEIYEKLYFSAFYVTSKVLEVPTNTMAPLLESYDPTSNTPLTYLDSDDENAQDNVEYKTRSLHDGSMDKNIELIVDLDSASPNVEVKSIFDYLKPDKRAFEWSNWWTHQQPAETQVVDNQKSDEIVTCNADEFVDSIMQFVICGIGCEPCGDYVAPTSNQPRKGILKKNTALSLKAATVETPRSKFPNRSLYYYNPEDDDVDDDDDDIYDSNESKEDEIPTLTRSVSFSSVDIKEFNMTLGDHPSATSGPPVMLDTEPTASRVVSLDDYEELRSHTRRKSRRQLKLSRNDRNGILVHERGFTQEQVNQACIESMKIRLQREETLQRSSLLSAFDDLFETVNSKYNIVSDVRK